MTNFEFSPGMTYFYFFQKIAEFSCCDVVYLDYGPGRKIWTNTIYVFQSVRVKISQNLSLGFSYFENLSQVNMTFENVFLLFFESFVNLE